MNIDALWDGATLTIPKRLADAYRSALAGHGLIEAAMDQRPKDAPIGGLTQEQTELHFAHPFDGSIARVELTFLNPRGETLVASNILRQFLAGGSLCLVDVPSGAGAGALSLLCAIAEFRELSLLPRQPLEVRLLWGEISLPARNYAMEMLSTLNDHLEEQAIFVTVDHFSWDVLQPVSNVELVEKIVRAKMHFPQVLLLVCNFSGFLERQGKWRAANPGLNMLLQFCSGDLNAGVWIEPDQKAVSGGLFQKLGAMLAVLVKFARRLGDSDEGQAASAHFHCPLGTGKRHRVNARSLPFELAVRRGSE